MAKTPIRPTWRRRSPDRGPLTILDMMALVVACAVAFPVIRYRVQFHQEVGSRTSYATYNSTSMIANAIFTALTIALGAIILWRSGGRVGLALRRPGPTACLAALVGIVVLAVRMGLKTEMMLYPGAVPLQLSILLPWLLSDFTRVGFAVLGGWVALLLTWGWRRERSSFGRVCQVVGWGWVILAFGPICLPWVEPFLPKT